MHGIRIGLIGAGNMARSLIGGLAAKGYDPAHIMVSNPTPEKLVHLQQQYHVQTTMSNEAVVAASDLIILAIKPQIMQSVVTKLAVACQEKHPLIVSVAAGVRTESLQQWLGTAYPIVRCMPNTPALVGCGATGLFASATVSREQKNQAESILRAVGLTVWLSNEDELDTVTALSGSGPAYFLLLMEALEVGAEQLGLTSSAAHLLTIQTALGAARLALESDMSVGELRKQVTSKGGTTEQAIQVFEQGGFCQLVSDALSAAKQRSIEMSHVE